MLIILILILQSCFHSLKVGYKLRLYNKKLKGVIKSFHSLKVGYKLELMLQQMN